MALTNTLVALLREHRGNSKDIIRILNQYNAKQDAYNRLTGEDILNAYKIGGLYISPINLVRGGLYEDKIRFSSNY